MIKSLFRLSLRMVIGFVQSLIKLCGLDWTAPNIIHKRTLHFVEEKSILTLRLAIKKVAMGCLAQYIAHRRLYGFKIFLGEGEWKRKKHQPEYHRQWCKMHIGIDAETLQIRAAQFSANRCK